jgi:CheY-like chemotaxis protein
MSHCPKRILIVEDNKADVRLLKDILESHGSGTLQTSNGLEAINLSLAYLPDLILMDIQLPEISGLEVTRRLRRDDRSRHIAIVAVTPFAMGWHAWWRQPRAVAASDSISRRRPFRPNRSEDRGAPLAPAR